MFAQKDRRLKLILLLTGVAVPLGGIWLWIKCRNCRSQSAKDKKNQLQEIAVEDSFPASDPPASW
jgi:outer membrane biogenesis lipoprotein LolB